MTSTAPARCLRRAQPLLGTLVEIGVRVGGRADQEALDAAFASVREVQSRLSRFDAHSDIARFNALPAGEQLTMHRVTRQLLAAAHDLQSASGGLFDISLGSAPNGWACHDDELHKLDTAVQLDLGGIGKGYAVDCAVEMLLARGCVAGWVNAGGDLRAFGDIGLPLHLRDETSGGARPFASLQEGAFATSHYDRHSRSRIATTEQAAPVTAHVSVAAPLCLWADALTKVVAISGDTSHPLLARFDAQAWLH